MHDLSGFSHANMAFGCCQGRWNGAGDFPGQLCQQSSLLLERQHEESAAAVAMYAWSQALN